MSAISRLGTYRYQPLPSPSSFRVLELLPGEEEDRIAFNLHATDWNAPVPYEAISYAWGKPHFSVRARCGTKTLKISPHVRNAFVAMRRRSESRYLWIDAICIDQGNIRERGHQVKIMRNIYEKAQRVLVWLGTDEEGLAAKAFEIVEQTAARLCSGTGVSADPADLASVENFVYLVRDYAAHDDEPRCLDWDSDQRHAVYWLFARSWFRRLWVVQESNANPDVRMMVGRLDISWHHVTLVATAYFTVAHLDIFWLASGRHNINRITSMRDFRNEEYDCLHLIHLAGQYEASDPRDRIYALLGLPAFADQRRHIEPDYLMSLAELHRKVATAAIQQKGDLAALSYVFHNPSTDDSPLPLPSWVPRWEGPLLFPAPGSPIRLNRPITVAGGCLQVNGIDVDVILELHRENPFVDGGPSSALLLTSDRYLRWWRRFLEPTALYPIGHAERLWEAYIRTATFGWQQKSPEWLASVIVRILYEHFPDTRNLGREEVCSMFALAGFTDEVEQTLIGDKVDALRTKRIAGSQSHAFYVSDPNRPIFRSANGHIGMAPRGAKVGDRVCVLNGGDEPFILRHEEDHWLLVGPAYVHDMMEGEAIDMIYRGEVEAKVFFIH